MTHVPWTLYRYIAKDLILYFVLSLAGLTLLFMVVSGIQAVDRGFTLGIVMPWILQSVGYSLFFTVPVSLLLSSTLCYGRLVADKEYTAMTASGISPGHLFLPVAALSTVLGIVAFSTQGTVLPRAHYVQRNIARFLVKQLEHLGNMKRGRLPIDDEDGEVYFEEVKGGTQLKAVHIEKKLPIGNLIEGGTTPPEVTTPEEEKQLHQTYIDAEYAYVSVDSEKETINLTLVGVSIKIANPREGYLFEDPDWAKYFEGLQFGTFTVAFPINEKRKREGDWTNAELKEKTREYRQNLAAAEEDLAAAQGEERIEHCQTMVAYWKKRIGKARSELWLRRALALSVLTFAFLAYPLSVSLRHRHRLVPFFAGTMLVVGIFYPMLLLGETLCVAYQLPASMAMMAGNVILLGITAFLFAKLLQR